MKINKILAAGIAATLAVTSLSAVTSAETVPYEKDIYQKVGKTDATTVKITAVINKEIGRALKQGDQQILRLPNLTNSRKNEYGKSDDIASITMDVEGFKYSTNTTGTQAATAVNMQFKFVSNAVTGWQWGIVVLKDTESVFHDGEFAPGYFDEISKITYTITTKGALETENEDIYKNWAGYNYNDTLIYNVQVFNDGSDVYGAADKNFGYAPGAVIANPAAKKAEDEAKIKGEAETSETINILVEGAAAGTNGVAKDTDLSSAKVYTDTGDTILNFEAPGADTVNVAGALAATGTGVTALELEDTTVKAFVGGTLKTIYQVKTADVGVDGQPWTTTDDTGLAVGDYVDGKGATAHKLTAAALAEFPVYKIDDSVDLSQYNSVVASADVAVANATAKTKEWAIGTTLQSKALYEVAATAKSGGTNVAAYLAAFALANGGYYVSQAAYGDTLGWNFPQRTTPGATLSQYNGWMPITTYNYYDNVTKTTYYTYDDMKAGVTAYYDASAANAAKYIALDADATNADKAVASRKCVTLNEDHKAEWVINRRYVRLLSDTGDYNSWGAVGDVDGRTQSYNDTMDNGTQPKGFAGLASQVAQFFNKQNNGKIIFTFTQAAAAGASDAWSSGVPSTEVGLIGSGAGTVTNNFALFFNYDSTGGMSYGATKADPTTGTVEIDISDYLDDCGGLTKSTLHDIYYGLNVGVYDDSGKGKDNAEILYGLRVSKVRLEYDDAAAATDADATDATDVSGEDDDDDEKDVVSTDDDDDDDDDDFADDDDDDDDDQWADDTDDDDDDDDDDDASLEDDTNDDDDTVNNETNVTNGDDEGDDNNPGTGAGLAVIPAIVAAAAVAVSKKRK